MQGETDEHAHDPWHPPSKRVRRGFCNVGHAVSLGELSCRRPVTSVTDGGNIAMSAHGYDFYADRYQSNVTRLLQGIHYFFGPKGSAAAFFACVSVSFGYSLSFFVLQWWWTDNGTIGNVIVIDDVSDFLTNVYTILYFCLVSVFIYTFFCSSTLYFTINKTNHLTDRYSFSISARKVLIYIAAYAATLYIGSKLLFSSLSIFFQPQFTYVFIVAAIIAAPAIFVVDYFFYFSAKATRSGKEGEEGAGVGAGSVVLASSLSSIALFSLTEQSIVGLSVVGLLSIILIFAFMFNLYQTRLQLYWDDAPGALTVGVFATFFVTLFAFLILSRSYPELIANEHFLIALIFFGFCPVINGITDFVSLNVSQFVCERTIFNVKNISQRKHLFFVFFGYLSLDFFIALSCVGLFVVLFSFSMAYISEFIRIYNNDGVFVVKEFLEESFDSSTKASVWITAMLLSTIIPTGIHVAILTSWIGLYVGNKAGPAIVYGIGALVFVIIMTLFIVFLYLIIPVLYELAHISVRFSETLTTSAPLYPAAVMIAVIVWYGRSLWRIFIAGTNPG